MNLIYISGSGRSGSTLLERILHSDEKTAALGEFHCLWRLPHQSISCSCGAPFHSDNLWTRVLAAAGTGASELGELAALEKSIARFGYLARSRFSIDALRADLRVQRFCELQFAILEAYARISGSETLIDSSKAGPRAWLLASDPRFRIVHLYRDPRDVMVSWQTAKFDPGLGQEMQRLNLTASARDWWKAEQLARMLARQCQVVRIDYAALATRPRIAVTAMLELLELAGSVRPQWLSDDRFEQGDDYHSLNGNPDRFVKGPVTIRRKHPDWAALSPVRRATTWAAGTGLAKLYPASTGT